MTLELGNFIDSVRSTYPTQGTFSRPELWKVRQETGNGRGFSDFMTNPTYKLSRGVYTFGGNTTDSKNPNIPSPPQATNPPATPKQVVNRPAPVVNITQHITELNLIPRRDPGFVPFGDFGLLRTIISSKKFFPGIIVGESGNGKTKMVYEACAAAKRELIRANITENTDEDDMIGGFRLQNGETVFQPGPAYEAAVRGAILLLDEYNLASPKMMCLQPLLEGNPIYIKKTNTLITPKEGFNIIATANEKGKASSDGRYIGSNIINEAALDRFAWCIEQEYPSASVENRILNQLLIKHNAVNDENVSFCNKLVTWANSIRSTFKAGGIDEMITTRRLIHIIGFHMISNKNRLQSLRYCIARFDKETQDSFLSLYEKIDETVVIGGAGDNKIDATVADVLDEEAVNLGNSIPASLSQSSGEI